MLKGVLNAIKQLPFNKIPFSKILLITLFVVTGISIFESVFHRNSIKSLRQTIHDIRAINSKQLRDSEQHLRNITSLNNELGEQKRKLDSTIGVKSQLENTNKELSTTINGLRTEFNTATQRNSELGDELQQVKQQLSDLNTRYGNLENNISATGKSVDDLGNIIEQLQTESGQDERDSGAIDGGIEKLVSGWQKSRGIVGQIRSTIEQYCTCEYPTDN